MFKYIYILLHIHVHVLYFTEKGGKAMLTSMRKFFTEKGQGIVEYALLLAFVVGIAIYVLSDDSGLKGALSENISTTASAVKTFNTGAPSGGGTGGGGTT